MRQTRIRFAEMMMRISAVVVAILVCGVGGISHATVDEPGPNLGRPVSQTPMGAHRRAQWCACYGPRRVVRRPDGCRLHSSRRSRLRPSTLCTPYRSRASGNSALSTGWQSLGSERDDREGMYRPLL